MRFLKVGITIICSLYIFAGLLAVHGITLSQSHSPQMQTTLDLPSTDPFARTILSALPDADGTTIRFAATGALPTSGDIWLSVNQSIGPGNHRLSYAMTRDNSQLSATAVGFAPRTDVGTGGDSTIQLTTTTTSGVQASEELNLLRAFVVPTQTRTIRADDGALTLEILSSEVNPSFSDDTYLAILSTNAQPGPLPSELRLVGNAYSVRPSGSILESQRLMTLNMLYTQAELGNRPPQTLAIAAWEFNGDFAGIVGGDLLESQQLVTVPINRFRIYGLVTTETWRDSFTESSLPGLASQGNVLWGPNQNLILASESLTGAVLSVPISLGGGNLLWSSVYYSVTVPASSTLVVDLVASDGTVVMTDVQDGDSLEAISAVEHPSLQLRARMGRVSPDMDSPQLHSWRIQSAAQLQEIYIPFIDSTAKTLN